MVNDASTSRKLTPAVGKQAAHAHVLRELSRTGDVLERELADDLTASWPRVDLPETAGEWITRPAVLRRVAGRLAELVPAEVHRIVGMGPGAIALATATSLITGLPFAIAEAAEPAGAERTDAGFGSFHEGEEIALVTVAPLAEETVKALLEARAVRMAAWIVVAAPRSAGLDGAPYRAVFTFDTTGAIRAEKERQA